MKTSTATREKYNLSLVSKNACSTYQNRVSIPPMITVSVANIKQSFEVIGNSIKSIQESGNRNTGIKHVAYNNKSII